MKEDKTKVPIDKVCGCWEQADPPEWRWDPNRGLYRCMICGVTTKAGDKNLGTQS